MAGSSSNPTLLLVVLIPYIHTVCMLLSNTNIFITCPILTFKCVLESWESDKFRGIYPLHQKNTTTLCITITESNIKLGKEGVYISYDSRGKSRGAIDTAGQAPDILMLVPTDAIKKGKLHPDSPFCFGSDSPLNIILLNGWKHISTPVNLSMWQFLTEH